MIYKKEYITCPICKSDECIREYDYLTLSEKIGCSNCKYKIRFNYINDKKGNTIKLDDNKDLTMGNLVSQGFLARIPVGIVINQHSNGEIIGDAFKSELHRYNTMLKYTNSAGYQNGYLKSSIYRFVNNKITVDVIFENQDDFRDDPPF